MPIYVFTCPEGHITEFLKLKKRERVPKYCTEPVTKIQKKTNQPETFECGLPLTKIIAPTNWRYTRGKNRNWPLTEEVDGAPLSEEGH